MITTLRSALLTHRARTLQAITRAQCNHTRVSPEARACAAAFDVAAHYAREHVIPLSVRLR